LKRKKDEKDNEKEGQEGWARRERRVIKKFLKNTRNHDKLIYNDTQESDTLTDWINSTDETLYYPSSIYKVPM